MSNLPGPSKMFANDPSESPEQFVERLRSSPSGRGVAGRAEVAKLAKQNPKKALQVARSIEHPWYRCQAIVSIAEANLSDRISENLLDEAFAAAYSQDEPNRVACVASWPLRLLVDRDTSQATARTKELLQKISQEPHGLRRLDGLRAILTAVAASNSLRELVLEPFAVAAEASQGWRTERIIDAIAEILLPFDRTAAAKLLSSRPPSRYTKRSRALLLQSLGADETDA